MEDKIIEFSHLANNWRTLYQEIKSKKKSSLEQFADTFTSTYKLLLQNASEATVEKKYLPIILNASMFAHIDLNEISDSKQKAVVVLTERMLSSIINCVASPSPEAVVYILELRQEICINFNDVGESINTLKMLFEDDYWNR